MVFFFLLHFILTTFNICLPAHGALRRAWPVLEGAVLAQPGQVLTNSGKYVYLVTNINKYVFFYRQIRVFIHTFLQILKKDKKDAH